MRWILYTRRGPPCQWAQRGARCIGIHLGSSLPNSSKPPASIPNKHDCQYIARRDRSEMSGLSLAIDIGGTFTDIVVYDPQAARHYIYKEYTTPRDPPPRGLLGGGGRPPARRRPP